MAPQIIIVLQFIGLFSFLFLTGEILYRALKIQGELTRKFAHLSCGLITLLFPVFLTELWQVAAISLSFLLLLLVSFKWNILPSINNVPRKTYGSVLFPISVFICFLFFNSIKKQTSLHFHPYFYFYLPMVVLAVSDPLAALVGKHFNKEKYGKTLTGSSAFAISSFIICSLLMEYFAVDSFIAVTVLFYATVASFISTIAERYSRSGWDNFTIPASLILLIWCFEWLS